MTAVEFLQAKAQRTEAALAARVDAWEGVPASLLEAVRYSLFAGGKRLRPALALAAAEVVSGDDSIALPVACALEMIHTYSLIHDDLPAMDDDDLRRGKPTCHKVYGEATAILAGDALLTMAFDAAADTGSTEIVRQLARAAGAGGMVGGQQLDLDGEGKQLDLEALRRIHRAKTGALIQVSLRCGAMAAGATAAQVDALADYGRHLGLAFQITDDILDVVGAEAVIGKPVGSDESRDKSTYPALLGLDESRRLAGEAVASALAALAVFGEEAENLRNLARFVADRES
ncbi:MAG: polyprenyl synthetase family protein [Candidatus Hydrogenedentes bacterium]|nr:polyprenyl synthetase family protein [Candidatus Hydrogenedentota bacterium]